MALKGSCALPISQSSPGGARGCRTGARLHRPWRRHRPELQEWKHSRASACQQSGQYLQHHTNKEREKWGPAVRWQRHKEPHQNEGREREAFSWTSSESNMRKYDRSCEKLKWNHSSASVKTDCFVFVLLSNAHLFRPGWSLTWALREATLKGDVSRFRKETLVLILMYSFLESRWALCLDLY